MFSIAFNRPLATIAVVGGLLVAAAPASAKVDSPKDQSSSAFSGDAYINEMGIMGAVDGAPMRLRNKVNPAYAQPEIDDEVLAYEPRAPRADGIIAILIGAVGTNDIEQDN